MRRLTKEPIVLDDILNSSVFTLIAAVAVAVTAIALQPDPHVESGAGRNLVGPSTVAATGPRQPTAAASNTSQSVVQPPTVVVTGRRLQPSEVVSVAATDSRP
jgi:hypothetical protein